MASHDDLGHTSEHGVDSKSLAAQVKETGYDPDEFIVPAFGSRYLAAPIPKDRFPPKSMPARVAQQVIRDMRLLDASPKLNLASFVTTWMEPECEALMTESYNINYIDESEYPSTTSIQNRCVSMLAHLYHAEEVCGTATVGSSEAILLGGLAMKRRWQERRKDAGIKGVAQPNMVCSSAVHVCWEKLFNYFDIEPRYINLTEDCFVAKPEKIAEACDENTIGVVAILGTTYSGHFEDVAAIDAAVGKLNEEHGWEIKIHIDGASGGFIAPFQYPDLLWDFKLKNVASINASGHKFGLVYPGVGWCIFRSKAFLPESLVFHDNYLGTDQISFTLNFSKGASQHIIGQYYQFLRLGFSGYKRIISSCTVVAMHTAEKIEALGAFSVVSARQPTPGVPLVAFTLKAEKRTHGYNEFDIADRLRQFGWVVPAYTMAPNAQKIRVLRVLCREDFSMQSAESFVDDLKQALSWLDGHFIYTPQQLKALQMSMKWQGVARRAVKVPLGKDGDVLEVPEEATPEAPVDGPVPRHGGVC